MPCVDHWTFCVEHRTVSFGLELVLGGHLVGSLLHRLQEISGGAKHSIAPCSAVGGSLLPAPRWGRPWEPLAMRSGGKRSGLHVCYLLQVVEERLAVRPGGVGVAVQQTRGHVEVLYSAGVVKAVERPGQQLDGITGQGRLRLKWPDTAHRWCVRCCRPPDCTFSLGAATKPPIYSSNIYNIPIYIFHMAFEKPNDLAIQGVSNALHSAFANTLGRLQKPLPPWTFAKALGHLQGVCKLPDLSGYLQMH